jgi:hypothetical protein
MSELEKINNHVEIAKNRLIEQYKERPKMLGLVEAIVKPLQVLEDEAFNVYKGKWLNTAQGAQLDTIGLIVGEGRLGRDDEDYRGAIYARIAMNVSSGEPDAILSGVKSFIGEGSVELQEYRANFHVHINTPKFSKNFRTIVESLKPIGIGTPIITYSATDKSLMFNSIGLATTEFEIITGEIGEQVKSPLIIVDDNAIESNLEIIVESPRGGFFEEGFGEVILNKVNLELGDGTILELENGAILELILDNAHEDYIISEFGGELGEAIT